MPKPPSLCPMGEYSPPALYVVIKPLEMFQAQSQPPLHTGPAKRSTNLATRKCIHALGVCALSFTLFISGARTEVHQLNCVYKQPTHQCISKSRAFY